MKRDFQVTDESLPDGEIQSEVRSRDPTYLQSDLMGSVHARCCGHRMHLACWQLFLENVVNKERRRPYR